MRDGPGRGGRPRPPATVTQRDLRLIAVAGRPEVGPYHHYYLHLGQSATLLS